MSLRYYENALKDEKGEIAILGIEKKEKEKETNKAEVCAIRDSTLIHFLFLSSAKDFRWNLSNLHNTVRYICLCLHIYIP